MEPLLEMAKDLAAELQQDERYIRTRIAQAAADEDEALQGMIGAFNLKRMALGNEMEKEDKDEEKMKRMDGELQEMYAAIMRQPAMAAYNAARKELDGLIDSINRILSMAANGANVDDIPEEHSCAGGCSGCSGCH